MKGLRCQGRANFFFGRGFNLEIFLNLQGSEFIQTLLLIYNHLAKFVVYKSWTRSALLKGTSRCFLVSSITCRSKEAIEWVWSFFVVKLSTKPHPLLVLCFQPFTGNETWQEEFVGSLKLT